MTSEKPDIVYHLAAQAIVRLSYQQPRSTFDVNVMGTVNVLEAARRAGCVRSVVVVTSDKCYRNAEWPWSYRETDELGGYDPYSASKAAAELAVSVFQHPAFQQSSQSSADMAVASVRAGNVIGGGDWALDRIVPDTIRAIANGSSILVRNPQSTRPWQHVLEPLSGYLWVGAQLERDPACRSAWNFGPREGRAVPVADVVTGLLDRWPADRSRLRIDPGGGAKEANHLRLDCGKSRAQLGWFPVWDFERTLDAVADWYRAFYASASPDAYASCVRQITEYTDDATREGVSWTVPVATGERVELSV